MTGHYAKFRICLLLLLLSAGYTSFSQTSEYVYRNSADSTVNCYLKIIPAGKIRGIIIRDYGSLPDTAQKSRFRLQELAIKNGMLMLYTVSSGFFPEMYYDDSCTSLLDDMVNEVISAHRIPRQNIFVGGISASGTRALRYAQYCEQGKSKFRTKVKGVFAADPPLDLERFYYSARNNMKNFKLGMLSEATMMVKLFPEKLGGTPAEVPMSYHNASVYAEKDSQGGNAKFYKNIPIIIFHEPDIDWWIKERGATYFDINSYDIAGFVNRIRLLGGNKIELVTTSGKGFDEYGTRKCHSWTIVDEDYLMNWILNKIED